MKKLYRSRTNKMIAGVCGGIAEYANIDATILRVLWAVLTLFSFGIALIAYIVATILIPVDPGYTDV